MNAKVVSGPSTVSSPPAAQAAQVLSTQPVPGDVKPCIRLMPTSASAAQSPLRPAIGRMLPSQSSRSSINVGATQRRSGVHTLEPEQVHPQVPPVPPLPDVPE